MLEPSPRRTLAICDICNRPRSVGGHAKCSQIRKHSKADILAIHQADKAAKALERRRYAR